MPCAVAELVLDRVRPGASESEIEAIASEMIEIDDGADVDE